MTLYLDKHRKVEGLTAEAVAGAHQRDLEVQGKYGVDIRQFWYNEGEGTIVCLIDAPNKEAAEQVHREAMASWLTHSSRSRKANRLPPAP